MSKKKMSVDLGSLDDFNVSDLMIPGSAIDSVQDDEPIAGKIVYLAFDILHDDPENSRATFDPQQIESLAESMKAISPRTGKPRGIKQPLSVRRHPELEGEYIINGGHRRKRAGILAGEIVAPCLIDDDADDYDNAIDNIERVGLTAMELAVFINRRLEKGDSKSEVAKTLGKPGSLISDHVIFFELPDFIRELYDENICTSMQGLAILHRAANKEPDAVKSFCIKLENEISVSQIRSFVESLKKKKEDSRDTETSLEQEASIDHDKKPGNNEERQEQEASTDHDNNLGSNDERQKEEASTDQDNTPSKSKVAEKELLQDLKHMLAKIRAGDVSQLDAADELIDLLLTEY